MSTLVFYVGFYHFLIYFRLKDRRENLSFAISCMNVGAYAVCCVGLYNSQTPQTGVLWQKAQVVILSAFGITLLVFVKEFIKEKIKSIDYIFILLFIIFGIATIILEGDLVFTTVVDRKTVILPFGFSFSYTEMVPGKFIDLYSVLGIIYGFYILSISTKYYLNVNKKKGLTLLTALFLCFTAFLNDILIINKVYSFIFLMEYSYIGIVLIFTFYLTNSAILIGKIKDKQLKSEKKYRTLFESTTDAIAIVDIETGKFTDCNKASLRLHNLDEDETIIGKTPGGISPPTQPCGEDSDKLALSHIKEALKDGSKVFEWVHIRKDGSTFSSLTTLSVLDMKGKTGLMAISKDISKLKSAEKEKEKLIGELKEALENIKTLSGLLPICSKCKKIKDDKGYWNSLESYIEKHSDVLFSHALCSQCSDDLYSNEQWYIDMKEKHN